MEIREKIVRTAKTFEGNTEISGNMGFNDQEFQSLMEAVGWQKTQAWCAYFVELVWKLAYIQNSEIVRELNLIMSGGAVATFNGFQKAGYEINKIPEAGDIVIWQKFKDNKPHWSGHAGIVIESFSDYFVSLEGNTNDGGSREGYIVAEQRRNLIFSAGAGLVIKGFIKPPKV